MNCVIKHRNINEIIINNIYTYCLIMDTYLITILFMDYYRDFT